MYITPNTNANMCSHNYNRQTNCTSCRHTSCRNTETVCTCVLVCGALTAQHGKVRSGCRVRCRQRTARSGEEKTPRFKGRETSRLTGVGQAGRRGVVLTLSWAHFFFFFWCNFSPSLQKRLSWPELPLLRTLSHAGVSKTLEFRQEFFFTTS